MVTSLANISPGMMTDGPVAPVSHAVSGSGATFSELVALMLAQGAATEEPAESPVAESTEDSSEMEAADLLAQLVQASLCTVGSLAAWTSPETDATPVSEQVEATMETTPEIAETSAIPVSGSGTVSGAQADPNAGIDGAVSIGMATEAGDSLNVQAEESISAVAGTSENAAAVVSVVVESEELPALTVTTNTTPSGAKAATPATLPITPVDTMEETSGAVAAMAPAGKALPDSGQVVAAQAVAAQIASEATTDASISGKNEFAETPESLEETSLSFAKLDGAKTLDASAETPTASAGIAAQKLSEAISIKTAQDAETVSSQETSTEEETSSPVAKGQAALEALAASVAYRKPLTVSETTPGSSKKTPVKTAIPDSGSKVSDTAGSLASVPSDTPVASPAVKASALVSNAQTQVLREPLTETVVKNVRYLTGKGQQSMTVRLVPASLGEIHLEVQSSGGEVGIRLISTNPVVRDALEANVPHLRETLSREGLQVGRLEIAASLGQSSGNGQSSNLPTYQDSSPRSSWNFSRTPQPASYEPSPIVRRVAAHQGALDLLV